jgi:hypothetical protein
MVRKLSQRSPRLRRFHAEQGSSRERTGDALGVRSYAPVVNSRFERKS